MGAEMKEEWRSWANETDNQQLLFWEARKHEATKREQDALKEKSAAKYEINRIRNRCVKRKTAYAKAKEDGVLTAGGMGSVGDHDRQDRP